MRPQIPIDKKFVSNSYERFLELPVPVVLAVSWFMGAALKTLAGSTGNNVLVLALVV
jgi:hypothetical protein